MHRPRFASRDALELRKTQDRYLWRTLEFWDSDGEGFDPRIVSMDPQKIIEALQVFHSTPAPSGPRNKEWLDAFDRQHAALQNVWEEYLCVTRSLFEQRNYSAADLDFSMEFHSYWKSPEYLARLDAKRESVLADIAKSKVTNIGHAFLPLPSSLKSSNDRASIGAEVKIKIKTKGTPHAAEDTAQVEQASEDPTIATINLSNKRSLTIFRAMFPSTPQELKTKVDWNTLIESMSNASFVVKNRGGGGSVVQFESNDGKDSINFHRPHLEPVVEPYKLHAMGWRMSRRFGWTRGMFVLGKK